MSDVCERTKARVTLHAALWRESQSAGDYTGRSFARKPRRKRQDRPFSAVLDLGKVTGAVTLARANSRENARSTPVPLC